MNTPHHSLAFVTAAALLGLTALATPASALKEASATAKPGAIPAHPDGLTYKALTFEAPARDGHRHTLSNGVPVFVVEEHALPLVTIAFTFRIGSYADPAGKEGLAALMAGEARRGGAGSRTAEEFDEEADFLAVQIGTGAGNRESSATLNVLTKDLDAGLDLLMDVVRRPRFQQDRLDLTRSRNLQDLERRNDNTTGIESREWRRLAYGADHFESTQSTAASLGGLTREDLVAFHARAWHPGNLLIAVSGDVQPADVLARLEKRCADWPKGEAAPAAPKPTAKPPVGIFLVNKDDVNQTRVSIGHLGTTWDDPNANAIEVMNEILGGGGFTSRITRRVRDDEGLAYSAGSGFGTGRDYPSTFRGAFQSKNKSVARAINILIGELERIRTEPVSDEELATATNGLIESFPSNFASAAARAGLFVQDELYGRPNDFWRSYRGGISAVTKADIQRVAKEYIHPDALTILVTGKLSEVMAGDPDLPDDSLVKRAGEAGMMEIALPDPSSLVYPNPPRPYVVPAAAATGGEGTK